MGGGGGGGGLGIGCWEESLVKLWNVDTDGHL